MTPSKNSAAMSTVLRTQIATSRMKSQIVMSFLKIEVSQFVTPHIDTNPMELQIIQQKIHEIRGVRVMLDVDLAELYGVEPKRLKEAVRRNIKRFPPDFMFELSDAEFKILRSQIVTSSWGGSRYPPFAFTENGVAMLSGILNSQVITPPATPRPRRAAASPAHRPVPPFRHR